MPDYSKKEVIDIVAQVAKEKNISSDDFLRFAYIETGGKFDENAYNRSSGAKGLFQFLPDAAARYNIKGDEFDPLKNTRAAADMFKDNLASMQARHERTGHPYLSGEPRPTGLDLYLAHQQGAAGYGAIQTAIATGTFGVVRERGQVVDMRKHVLSNIGEDAHRLTGHSVADLRKMNDRDLATNFAKYYDQKYDAISIPEKNIAPRTQGQASTPAEAVGAAARTLGTTAGMAAAQPAAQGMRLEEAYRAGVQYDDVKYAINIKNSSYYRGAGIDGKHIEQGYIDCSGWVGTLQNKTMDEINRQAGRTIFSKDDKVNLGNHGSGTIVHNAYKSSGVLLDRADILKPGALKEGMVIGLDTARTQHEHWKGIDHIVMVVRNPNNGELLISQSTGSKGVHTMPVAEYLKQVESHPNWKLFGSDPLAKARDLLQTQTQDRAPVTPGQSHTTPAPQRSPAAPMADGMLKHGEKGTEIRVLQEQLTRQGYLGGDGKALKADGVYGDNTLAAVRAFQSDHGIKDSGIVGPKTLAALSAADKQPLLSDARHPQHEMYGQALKGLQALPADTFKNQQALHNAAAALVYDARVSGMQRIDTVVASTNGQGLFAVQGAMGSPGQLRVHVDKAHAAEQPLTASNAALQQLDQEKGSQEQQQAQTKQAISQ